MRYPRESVETEHPVFRMWLDRLEVEMAQEEARKARSTAREVERASWYEAWWAYKARLTETREPRPTPRWWDLPGWVRWLFKLHAPGRPG